MLPDVLSATLRALSFVLLMQAAGATIFLAAFGRDLSRTVAFVRRLGTVSALAAVGFAAAHYALEAARMAGDMAGVFDGTLQGLVAHSTTGLTFVVRVLGLLLIAVGSSTRPIGLIGVTLVAASFALTGHTAVHPERWILAPLLALHVVIGAFWFGSLLPLHFISAREEPFIAGRVTAAFTRLATWLVPVIFVAGVCIAWRLIADFTVLFEPYGALLLAKIGTFALLMGLAAANKWRLGPAVARGESQGFRQSLVAEIALIVVALAVTAVMTSFFSPEV